MKEPKKVIATLLIKMVWDREYIENWKPTETSESHAGCMGNLWLMKCYDNDSVMKNLEALTGLDSVDDVVVYYGETTWAEYAAEKGIELEKFVCKHEGCEEFDGDAILGQIFIYTGPL